MRDTFKQLARLTPEKRALLRRQLETAEQRLSVFSLSEPLLVGTGGKGMGGQETFPLSFHQEQLWVLDQLNPGNATYNVPLKIPLHGPLNVEALCLSLNSVIRRHAVLRTVIEVVNRQPSQRILSNLDLQIPIVDLTLLDMEKQAAEITRLSQQEALQPFDLRHGPLLHPLLLRFSNNEHLLLLTIHHIVFDGWSLELLVREMAAYYTAECRKESIALPELVLQYGDYACWQRNRLSGQLLERYRAFWKQQLEGAPTLLHLSIDHPRPSEQRFRGTHQEMTLPADVLQQLEYLCRQEHATLFMCLMAAFAILLSRFTSE